LNFTGPPFSLVRARLHYFYDPPQLTRIAEPIVKVLIVGQKPQAGKVGHHRAGPDAHKYIDTGTTLGTDDVRSPNGDFVVRQVQQYAAVRTGHFHAITYVTD